MNHITIELCAEDRARLDSLIVLAAKLANRQDLAPAEAPAEVKAEEASAPAEIKAEAPTEDAPPWDPIESFAQHTEKPEPVKEEKPAVTLAQIQQKVVQLCAGFGGKKKPQVREIISTYGEKVSDLKEQPDKWDEVWNKLTMLEIEEV